MPKWGYVFIVFIVIGIIATAVTFLVIRANPVPETRRAGTTAPVATGPASIFVSEDGGATWSALSGSEGLTPLVLTFKAGQLAKTSDNAYLYVGTKGAGLWIRKSGNSALERIHDPSNVLRDDADVYSLAQTITGNDLYLGILQNQRGRLVRMTESTAEEIFTTILERYPVLAVYVDPQDPLHINIAAEGAFLEARDGGRSKSWETLARVRDGIVKFAASDVDGKLWALDTKQTLFVTTVGGRIWREQPQIVIEEKRTNRISDMQYHRERGSLIIAADEGLAETYDDGETWSVFRTLVPSGSLPITAVGVHPRLPEVMWMAAGHFIYRSDDGGITWRSSELPSKYTVRMIAVDPLNPKYVYAGISE